MNKEQLASLQQGLKEAIAMNRGEPVAGRIWQFPLPDKKTLLSPVSISPSGKVR